MTRPSLGAVVIGRNEGDRLKACLHSLVPVCDRVVYVDSGSRDDSVAFARGLGVTVVELDTTTPFTAARARNAGFQALIAAGDLDLAQFVDGDCTVQDGWLAAGTDALAADPVLSQAMGEQMVETYLAIKRKEAATFKDMSFLAEQNAHLWRY